jgi:hypothetical protein
VHQKELKMWYYDPATAMMGLILGAVIAILVAMIMVETRMEHWPASANGAIILTAWLLVATVTVVGEADDEADSGSYARVLDMRDRDCRMRGPVDAALSDGPLSTGDLRVVKATRERIALDDVRRRARGGGPAGCTLRTGQQSLGGRRS